ncbi:MAG: hypothetical protein KDB27_35345 [Planctomycetales bacterium]|nr:hypothetical protein [Planctomycetales bacterium]
MKIAARVFTTVSIAIVLLVHFVQIAKPFDWQRDNPRPAMLADDFSQSLDARHDFSDPVLNDLELLLDTAPHQVEHGDG